ncbi:hypothetical protein ACFLX9_04075 [Chloroflexota bacterium]
MPGTHLPEPTARANAELLALNPQEEVEYESLRRMGQRLHVPIPEAFWDLLVVEKDGAVRQRLKQRSHSFVRNAFNHLIGQLAAKNGNGGATFGGGFINIRETGGYVRTGNYPILTGHSSNSTTTSSLDSAGGGPGIVAPAGNNNKGIVVGSGANPESFEDYALQSLILNGTSAGRLSYIQSESPVVSYDGGTLTLTVTHVRFFNNNSGGPVDVNEVGIYLLGKTGYGGQSDITWMVARDKLVATVQVPDTGQLKVTYTISLTYPA